MAQEEDPKRRSEDRPGEPGAEGGSGGSAETPPPLPDEDDDTPLGDADQHSEQARLTARRPRRRPAAAARRRLRARGLSPLSLAGLLVSLVCVAGVVWWARRQQPPQLPTRRASGARAAAPSGSTRSPRSCAGSAGARSCAPRRRAARAGRPRAERRRLCRQQLLPARAGRRGRVFLMAPRAAEPAQACSARCSPSDCSTSP